MRALASTARAEGRLSRQHARAAARRFVRRHRRNTSYLRWVLRSIAANGALALALLGLDVSPAAAGLTFIPQIGAANPLAGQDAGFNSNPALGDLDGDGDLDLVSGEFYGTLRYYENTGSSASPAFLARTGTANPLNGQDVGYRSAPALCDLDGDGDLDLVVGTYDPYNPSLHLAYFENTGSSSSPAFVLRTGTASPLSSINPPDLYLSPTLGDLDGDGDLDLFAGHQSLGVLYFENTGSSSSAAFVARTGTANPLPVQSLQFANAPALGDVDGDGDLDVVNGDGSGTFSYYENTGSSLSPAFVALSGTANPLSGQDVGGYSTPALGDLDGDGDLDLVSGEGFGTFFTFLSEPLDSDGDGLPDDVETDTGVYVSPSETGTNPFDPDSDGDGLGDPVEIPTGVFVSATDPGTDPNDPDSDGDGFWDFAEIGFGSDPTDAAIVPDPPRFVPQTGTANPFGTQDAGLYPTPALGDLDGDGDLDVVSGATSGSFRYWENTGPPSSPAFVARNGTANPLNGQSGVGAALGDLDGDGDLDLVSGQANGAFRYFENTGSSSSPAFVARTGTANPLGGFGSGQRPAPALGDLDGDGDLDLVNGEILGTFLYYENTGSSASPAFAARTGTANPLDGQDVGGASIPTLGDVDGDGDLDLVSGETNGGFRYYENTGAAMSPAFVARVGTANPLNGRDVGQYSTPALGDVDADGDLDVVAGEGYTLNPLFYFRAEPLDSDGDGTPNPRDPDDDNDGLLDVVETNTGVFVSPTDTGTDPFDPDSDGDGLLDGVETNTGVYVSPSDTGTDPNRADSDGDGVRDAVETNTGVYVSPADPGTDPNDPDSDGDGFRDGAELAFGSDPTDAGVVPDPPHFVAQTGTANPLLLQDPGSSSTPALGDLDGDGDLDLVSGLSSGPFIYYENTGSYSSPVFVQRTGTANPLTGQTAGSEAAPTLGDLDGDGDLDLVNGASDGTFSYFENTGSIANPAFAARTGTANPLAGQDVGNFSKPALGDLDGDGDLDLVSGGAGGVFFYYENTGSSSSPVFVAANLLGGQDVGYNSTPALADVDGDGDLDLVSGEYFGAFAYYENTGSSASPAFALRTGAANPLSGQDVGFRSAPTLGDLDGDGGLDLISGEQGGSFFYFLAEPLDTDSDGTPNPLDPDDDNDGLLDTVETNTGVYVSPSDTGTDPLDPDTDDDGLLDGFETNTGVYVSPSDSGTDPNEVDSDGDGFLDRIEIAFGSDPTDASIVPGPPRFVAQTGTANPLNGQGLTYLIPTLGDLDGDGDLDLVSGTYGGGFVYFENTGSSSSPAFAARFGTASPLNYENPGSRSAPTLGDLDGDGDLDLVSGEYYGTFVYYENTGSPSIPAFTARYGTANPLNGQDVGFSTTPTLSDLDGDGDLDLVSGEQFGYFLGYLIYYENTGSPSSPAFVRRTGTANPLNGHQLGYHAKPALGDVDGDGDLDLLSGGFTSVRYFENTGSTSSPAFVERTGTANPLTGQSVGLDPAPALGDTDGDGDLDLVNGTISGGFTYFLAEPLDSDGDGTPNPRDPDDDNDGLLDSFELQYGFDPLGTDESGFDGDMDGLTNLAEQAAGTDPFDPDTDADGLSDGVETNTGVYVSPSDTGTDPLDPDSDGDGFSDAAEVAAGSNPNDANSTPVNAVPALSGPMSALLAALLGSIGFFSEKLGIRRRRND